MWYSCVSEKPAAWERRMASYIHVISSSVNPALRSLRSHTSSPSSVLKTMRLRRCAKAWMMSTNNTEAESLLWTHWSMKSLIYKCVNATSPPLKPEPNCVSCTNAVAKGNNRFLRALVIRLPRRLAWYLGKNLRKRMDPFSYIIQWSCHLSIGWGERTTCWIYGQ